MRLAALRHTRRPDAIDDMDDDLDAQFADIGMARFVGRINSGLIDAQKGYQAVERLVHPQKRLSYRLLAVLAFVVAVWVAVGVWLCN